LHILLLLTNTQQIQAFAKQAILDELKAIKNLPDFIDETFASICELVVNANGRLIITGIGKSAIIAQKIVATMNSTGQPAIFMHAADAIHGDLGIIQQDDIVLAISKSGNTPELKALVPYLKNFGNPLIGMVGNTNSYLAQEANYVIDSTVDKEACPHNLAPTSSTTAQLIMGDALAIALMKLKNFSSHDFSKYHPGGALGKKLYLTCGQIASNNLKPLIAPTDSIEKVIEAISKGRLGATAVGNANHILGIVTDGDLRRMLLKSSDFKTLTAQDIMSPKPTILQHDTLAAEAALIMQSKKISQIIVTQNQEYQGMVHAHDCAKEGII
jgi:arabinose-5-phosphate isomerase